MPITHDEVLAHIAVRWIDMSTRRSLPKRKLPPHAHEPSPNVVVSALPADKSSSDVSSQFLQKHWKPRFNMAHVPGSYVWQFLTPDGRRLMLFTWSNWQRNTRKMFEDFCRDTGREFGRLSEEGTIHLGDETIAFRECRLVHEDEFRPRPEGPVKCQSAKSVLAKAEKLLKRRASEFEEIDSREFYDDIEAHDNALQETLEENFRANFAKYEEALSKKYGPPAKAASGHHRDIPLGGVLQYAIWKIGKKSLYLAVTHEDRELPWTTTLGAIVV